MSNTRNLINAIADGNALDTESAFNTAMAEKISAKIDTMRQEIAQNMFATEEHELDEVEEIDETEELDEDELDEAHRRGGNRFLNTREKDAIQKKMKPLDPKAPVEYKDKYSITRGRPHEEQLLRHIHAATGHHVYISPFTHALHPHDSKEVITKEVYNTGGKGSYGGPGGTKHTPNSLVQAVKKFHNKKLRTEEVEEIDETEEQIDELSKGTLKSYVKKAGKSAQHYSFEPAVVDPESGHQYRPTYTKRVKGINLAKDKLKREEVDQGNQTSDLVNSAVKVMDQGGDSNGFLKT
jgi:hypothetical protein